MLDLTRIQQPIAAAMGLLVSGPQTPLLRMCQEHLGIADGGTPAGKMARPALCLTFCEGYGGNRELCLPAALAVELVHRTSLVFDDIQDDSPARNGQPSLWSTWGKNQAINAGLQLSAYARLALQEVLTVDGTRHDLVAVLSRLLERAVLDLCEGQYLDLAMESTFPDLENYREMVRLKTGALLGAACEAGAVVAGADPEPARRFGEALGIVFQCQDDYLGVWGDPAVMGKEADDLDHNKRGLPLVLGFDLPGGSGITQVPLDRRRRTLEEMGVKERARAVIMDEAGNARSRLTLTGLPDATVQSLSYLVDFAATRDK